MPITQATSSGSLISSIGVSKLSFLLTFFRFIESGIRKILILANPHFLFHCFKKTLLIQNHLRTTSLLAELRRCIWDRYRTACTSQCQVVSKKIMLKPKLQIDITH